MRCATLLGKGLLTPDLRSTTLLESCDFFVFPSVKKKLRGRRLVSAEVAVEAIDSENKTIPVSEWREFFEK